MTKKTMKKDGRVKVTAKQAEAMKKALNSGKSINTVAAKYGVTTYTVRYNTDNAFKKSEQTRKRTAYKHVV